MADNQTTEALHRDWFGKSLAEGEGKSDALKQLTLAEHAASAKAARLLAERECPADLIEWGRAHGIPTFAGATWQAGFLTGMRVAMLDRMKEAEDGEG